MKVGSVTLKRSWLASVLVKKAHHIFLTKSASSDHSVLIMYDAC